MRIKPATYTDSIHAIFRISSQQLCRLNYDRMSIKQNDGLIRNGIRFLSSRRWSHVHFPHKFHLKRHIDSLVYKLCGNGGGKRKGLKALEPYLG